MRDYAAIAKEYAQGITAGKIIAGRLVKLACARFLRDLDHEADPAWPYRFDAEF